MVKMELSKETIEWNRRLQMRFQAGDFGSFNPPKQKSGSESEPKAYGFFGTSGSSYKMYSLSFNGEKNLGEIGPVKNYRPDYVLLRLRSWQAYLESDIAQTIIKKFVKWVVGPGLKLQAEPDNVVLESEGIKLDTEQFNDIVEARFAVFSRSKSADYAGMRTLNKIARVVKREAVIGGDVLVIQRYIDDMVKIQVVDGIHVMSPMFGDEYFPQALKNGNEIRNGVELSPTGQHIAYYVRKGFTNGIPISPSFEVERIPARTEDGLITAFLVYGLEYRLDNHRGLPLISALLETIKKLERYKEATLGSAEELAKLVYFIEHQLGSTGENPFMNNMAKAFNVDAKIDDIPEDQQGKQIANTIVATTNKQAINMPVNSTIKTVDTKNSTLYFKDFFTVNGNLLCSALNIPPDVAFSKYDSNFSASRAALKDWEHTLLDERSEFSEGFYQMIYNYWLDIEILKNKVQARGYLKSRMEKNIMVLEAYRKARFVGSAVPHIDPLKEVNAERAKLGPAAAMIPLTTVEAATEALNGGESDQNIQQFAKEVDEAKKLKLIQPPKQKPDPSKQ